MTMEIMQIDRYDGQEGVARRLTDRDPRSRACITKLQGPYHPRGEQQRNTESLTTMEDR